MQSILRRSWPAAVLALAMIALPPAGDAQTAAPTPQQNQSGAPATGGYGMMGQGGGYGMMGQGGGYGMMGQGGGYGMTGGGPGYGMMGAGRGMMGGAMMVDHVEGRLAFLKTELKITAAQMPKWDKFADAMRAAAKSMSERRQQFAQGDYPATLPARLDLREKMLQAQLDAAKETKAALDPLYASFSNEQKQTADDLMTGPMGMM